VGAHHLDVGPGTGYFLDVADLPQLRRLVLIDPNPAVLDHAGRRLARFDPVLLEANVVVPIDHRGGVDSVGCNFVLHCLPGTLGEKAEAIANLTRLLRPGVCSSDRRSSASQTATRRWAGACWGSTTARASSATPRTPGTSSSGSSRATSHRRRDRGPRRGRRLPRHQTEMNQPPATATVPWPATSLIGRDEELQTLPALLGKQRLVTLTGTGGLGKTRSAEQLTAQLPPARSLDLAPSPTLEGDAPWRPAARLPMREGFSILARTAVLLWAGAAYGPWRSKSRAAMDARG
jgi:hypothetical protein